MRHWSLARRLSAGLLLGLLALTLLAGSLSFLNARDTLYRAEGEKVLATARLLAVEPGVVEAYAHEHPERLLQPIAGDVSGRAGVSWVTFLSLDGTRLSHWMPDWVGSQYPGRLEPAISGAEFVETSTTGEAGPSVRALVPVRAGRTLGEGSGQEGPVVGVVSVGQRISQLDIAVRAEIPRLVGLAAIIAVAGLLTSWAIGRYLDRTTLGMGPEQLAANFTFLDTALHNVLVGILLFSRNGRLQLYNDRAADLLELPAPGTGSHGTGRRAARAVVGTATADLDLPEPLAELLASRRDAEDELFAVGDRILVVNQHPARPVRGRGRGEVTGTVVTLYDRTHVQEMNRELESTRSLTDALRSQTHEHANRLHTLYSLLELDRPDQARELIAQSLDATGTGSGPAAAAEAEPALDALMLAKAAQARERGVAMAHRNEVDSPTGIPSQHLVTLMGNLLDNAIDAAAGPDPEPADRWVDAEARLEGRWLVLQVADGGPGPAEADRERIFELGFSTKPAGPAGRGVGLALVRQTARQLGGDVELVQDSGTVFTVELPLRERGTGRTGRGTAGTTAGARDDAAAWTGESGFAHEDPAVEDRVDGHA